METPTHTSLLGPVPSPSLGRSIDSLDRLRGFLHALRDSFEVAALTHNPELSSRLSVCDYVEEELQAIADDLQRWSAEARSNRRDVADA